MEELEYKARLFWYTKNRPIRFIQDDEMIGFLLSDVQKVLNDPDIQFTNVPLITCTVIDQNEETNDFIIEKDDLCGFIESRTQTFKASLLSRRVQLAFAPESPESKEMTEVSSKIRLTPKHGYVQVEESGTDIPAVYEFNYNWLFLRAVIKDHQAWFVAYDICQKILELGQTEHTIGILPPEERRVYPIKSLGTVQDMDVINKAGLERIMTQLSKFMPEAVKLKKWIDQEVMPKLDEKIACIQEIDTRTQEKLQPLRLVGSIKLRGCSGKPSIDVHMSKGKYWLEQTQVGTLLGYTDPSRAMNILISRHSNDLKPHTMQERVAQREGNRMVDRSRSLISTEGLQVMLKMMQDPQKQQILQTLIKELKKITQAHCEN